MSRFEFWFFTFFVIGLGGSVGVAYGWTKAFDTKDLSAKRDFSFVGSLAALVIILLTLADIHTKRRRLSDFIRIMSNFPSLIDTVFFYLGDQEATQFSVLVLTKPNEQDKVLTMVECTREVLVGILMSATLILWQSVKYKEDQDKLRDEAIKIVRIELAKEGRVTNDQFSGQFASALGSIYPDSFFGVALLNVVLDRIKRMSSQCLSIKQNVAPAQMLSDSSALARKVATIKERLDTFEYDYAIRPWWWVPMSVNLMGILYPFVIPPAYYTLLGNDIIFVGPITFFFVGGLVLINICLGDPFSQPTNVQMGHVYAQVQDMPLRTRKLFVKHFITGHTPRDLQPPPVPATPPTGVTKQQQLQLQQSEEARLQLLRMYEQQNQQIKHSVDSNFFENVVDEFFLGATTDYISKHK